MKPLSLALLLFASSVCASSLELLPKGRPFRLTFADPREVRMGLTFEGSSKMEAMVGNYFSLLEIRSEDEASDPLRAHFGLEGAGYFGMRQADGRFPLETTDGLVGAYFEGGSERFQTQLRYTHISSHLADGSSGTPIAYSREYLSLRVGWVPTPLTHLYAGAQWLTNAIPPVSPLAVQWGASAFIPMGLGVAMPFVAADFKWRAESAHNPSLALQLGLALNDTAEAYRSFRVYYSYFTGMDPRGQFIGTSYTSHALGIEMQI